MQRSFAKTFVLTGAATVGGFWGVGAVTKGVLGTVRLARIQQARKRGDFCKVCKGKRKTQCQVCLGVGALDYKSFVKSEVPLTCICPLCKGSSKQKCPNCLGVGVTLAK